MRKQATKAILIAALALVASSGCSQIQTVFHDPDGGAPARSGQVSSRPATVVDNGSTRLGSGSDNSNTGQLKLARVASYQPAEVRTAPANTQPKIESQEQTATTNSAPNQSTAAAENINTNGAQRSNAVATDAQKNNQTAGAPKRAYTAPSAGIRSTGPLSASMAAFVLTTTENRTGATLSQSRLTNEQGTQSAAALGAPNATINGVRVSADRLLSNLQTAQGRAEQFTVFTPQINRASGPNGGLCTLSRVGLLENNRACQSLRHRH
ncbi:MAG TPA: hypothetical protein PKN33_07290 [Phycisphaerae bacterium]|nr:hypothetical protein [Phycisphaerae bacterium]